MQMTTQHGRIETCRRRATRSHSFRRVGESDWLVTKGCEYFLVPQQPIAVRFEDQDRLTRPAAGCIVPFVAHFNVGSTRQPDLKLCPDAGCAADLHGARVLEHDLADSGEAQSIAAHRGREKGPENPFERDL